MFVCVSTCVRVWLHACFWVMGFVHPLLLTARMYPWQRQVDPSCELVRGTWKGALNLSSHLPCALLSLTMAKCMALLKSQPRGCTPWLPPWTLASQHCHLLTWCKRCTRKTFSYCFFFYFLVSSGFICGEKKKNLKAKSTQSFQDDVFPFREDFSNFNYREMSGNEEKRQWGTFIIGNKGPLLVQSWSPVIGQGLKPQATRAPLKGGFYREVRKYWSIQLISR